jgi:anti-sigma-K factor RskA
VNPHTLAAPYALDALDTGDAKRFERHLARCADCAQEVAGLRETAARLAGAAAIQPPEQMRDAVLAAAASSRQAPPLRQLARRVRAAPARLRIAVAATGMAALVAVAVVFGLASSDANGRLTQAQRDSQAIAAVLTAKDATMMSGRVTGGGSATIVMSHARQALVFTAQGLPALPGTSGYELWLIGPGGVRAAGMLPASVHGMTGPVIAAGLRQGDHLMLSVEPGPAGTRQPTSRMMLDIPL